MKKIIKIIGTAAGVALAAGLVPTHIKTDKETGEFEIGGLLWNLKKAPGEEEDTYTMQLLPFIDKEDEDVTEVEVEVDDAVVESASGDEAVEEPFSDETSNEVVVETAEEPDDDIKAEAHPKVEITVDLTDNEAPIPSDENA